MQHPAFSVPASFHDKQSYLYSFFFCKLCDILCLIFCSQRMKRIIACNNIIIQNMGVIQYMIYLRRCFFLLLRQLINDKNAKFQFLLCTHAISPLSFLLPFHIPLYPHFPELTTKTSVICSTILQHFIDKLSLTLRCLSVFIFVR